MTNENKIMVSVCMITYNHEKFIKQAIEGVINQKTNFSIELIIGEDLSKDATRQICIEYQQQYPEIIKLNLSEGNVGGQQNFLNTYALSRGKYIALCEGDDYWTDEYKLQKQVDFLETNPTYVLSSHNSAILGHNKKMIYNPPLSQTELNIYDIIDGQWNLMTASLVFRKNALSFPDWFSKIRNGDYALQLLLATKGLFHYIPEYMSVYRRHLGGVSLRFTPIVGAKAIYDLCKYFNKETNYQYKKEMHKKLNRIYTDCIVKARDNGLRKQYLGLLLVRIFAKAGIDIMPGVFSVLSK